MNEVKIVVTGSNRFGATRASVEKDIRSLGTTTDKAAESAKKLQDQLAKPVKSSSTKQVADDLDKAAKSADGLIARMKRLGQDKDVTSGGITLGQTFRHAVDESSAALDELMLTLWRAGHELGETLYRGLRLDRAQAALSAVGTRIAGVFDQALEPVRRARDLGVAAAQHVADAWDNAIDRVQDVAASAARAVAAGWAAAMAPVHRARATVVDIAKSIGDAFDRGMTRVQVVGVLAAAKLADGFDRVAAPAIRVGNLIADSAGRAGRAFWSATAPVREFGSAVADVAGQSARLVGRMVAPFGKVGSALVDKLGEAGTRGGHALVGAIGSVLDKAGTVAGKAFSSVAGVAKSGFEAGQSVASSMWKGFTGLIANGLPPEVKAGLGVALLTGIAVVGPLAGGALAGGIVAGFGAGIGGLGVLAAAQTSRVQSTFGSLFQDLKTQSIQNSQPIEDMLIRMAGRTKTTFENLEHHVRGALAGLTGPMEHLGDGLLKSLERFAPALRPLAEAAGKVMDDVAARLPGVVGELGDEFSELAEEISRNPEALGDFIALAGEGIEILLDLAGALNRAWEQWKNIYDVATTPLEWIGLKDGEDAAADLGGKFTDVARITYDTASATEGLEQAFKDLAAAGDDAAKRGQALLDVLDIIAGRAPTFEESVQNSNDTIRDLIDTFSNGKNHVDGFGEALLNADGTINTTTANGSLLRDAITGLQSDFANMAGATKELEMAGLSHQDALAKVNGQMMEQRNRLIENAGQMGLTREKMQALLDTYGLNPKILETLARLDDAEARRVMADLVKNRTATIFVNYMTTNALGAGSNGGVVLGGPNRVMAHGGVSPGGWTTVGELGPERVMLPPGAQVMPYTRSEPTLGTQGGGSAGSGGPLQIEWIGAPTGELERAIYQVVQKGLRVGRLQLSGSG